MKSIKSYNRDDDVQCDVVDCPSNGCVNNTYAK